MIRIRRMTAADIPLGMRLKDQASWNQTEVDWRRCLDLEPAGCFVAETDGAAVGSTTTCIFGKVAWIAMVLVDSDCRGRGIGKALMEHALAYLDESGVASIRLDATPLGQPLYEKLGFNEQFALTRFEGIPTLTRVAHGTEPAPAEWWETLAAFDSATTRTDRFKLLRRLFEERPESVRLIRHDGSISGFCTVRIGSRAVQIGPCIADAAAGPALIDDACLRHVGQRVYLDVPALNGAAIEYVLGLGLAAQRQLTRMCRGRDVREDLDSLWTSSGPEKG